MTKLKEIIDKYPWLLIVVPIIIVAFAGFLFLSGKHTSSSSNPAVSNGTTVSNEGSGTTTQSSNASNASTAQNSGFNIFSFILRLFDGNTGSSTQNTTATTSNASTANGSSQTAEGNSSNSSSGSTTSTTGNGTQNSSSGSQASGNPGSAISPTPIPIIFKTPDGGTQVYDPPATPPVAITWGRYVNAADRYAIDYPTNWQVVKTEYNGHEGISVYLPGTDASDPNAQYIGFGLASYYLLPNGNSQESTYSYPITVDTTNGTMYTQGVLGNGSIAAVFQYEQGSFGLGSNVSDPDFIYVYNHMLQSLSFGPQ